MEAAQTLVMFELTTVQCPDCEQNNLVYEASFSQSARYHMHLCIHVCICWLLPEPTVTGNNNCYQSCTCQLFLSQMSEIFVTILPEFPTTSEHC